MIDRGRRRFFRQMTAGGVLLGLSPLVTRAADNHTLARGTPAVLSGTHFHLDVREVPANFSGKPDRAIAINGSIPAPTLHFREGDTVMIHVTNHMSVTTSIHWHGILLPFQMDGVPGISFPGIAPGETFVYQFKLVQAGTYWYHSHSALQEMKGMYGAMVVSPRGGERIQADRDHAVVLSDWADGEPMTVFAKLKQNAEYFQQNKPTVGELVSDIGAMGVAKALEERRMWNEMRMSPADIADVSGAALTYLVNGKKPGENWTGIFARGERVRLRFINAASNTFYDVRIPGVKLEIVQADGVDVEPVTVDEFRFGPGETYDAIVRPEVDACTIFAQAMDRTGYARATLAVRSGLDVPVPAVDPPQRLTMTDMMGEHGHGNGHHGASHIAVRHASTEFGPSVDMRVDTPRTNLDDPGVGLRGNGRRVLTLADLKTLGGALDHRDPTREIELHLTGNMERYTWSFDGLEFGRSTPVHFPYGERIRVILHNDTMMTHPMHLHGMWSEQTSAEGDFLSRRHTIPVQPAQRITFDVTADALGRWAWHCHLLFHMDAGMFREVVVA